MRRRSFQADDSLQRMPWQSSDFLDVKGEVAGLPLSPRAPSQ